MVESAQHPQWSPPGLPPSLLEQVLGAMGEGVVVHSSTGELIAANHAAQMILGLTTDEIRGAAPLPAGWEATRENGHLVTAREHPALVALRTGMPVGSQLIAIARGDGSTRWIQAASRPSMVDGDLMAITTFADVTALRHSQADIEYLAQRDELTGLVTRLTLEQLIEAAVARALNNDQEVVIMAVGIDHFSLVNQRLGAMGGDEMLVEMGRRLRDAAGPGAVVARLGGDQFCVMLEDQDREDDPRPICRGIRAALDAPMMVGSTRYLPSVTLGVASLPGDTQFAGDLLVAAVGALEAAKHTERGSVVFYGDLDPEAALDNSADQVIRQAIDLGSVQLWYQPVVAVRSGRQVGVEALFRIAGGANTGSGILTPEVLGVLGPRIASHVLSILREDAKTMHATGDLPPAISVNLTAPDLLIPRVKEEAIRLSTDLQSLGSRLVVEVSEQIGLGHPAIMRPILEEMREAAVSISLDDFGTGTNSLALLRELPLDSLKLDSSFLLGAMTNSIDRAIIKATTALAAELGLPLIAEGVETAELFAFVKEQGIPMAQGYFFDRPSPVGGHAEPR